jgi:hypothetical protein
MCVVDPKHLTVIIIFEGKMINKIELFSFLLICTYFFPL